MPTALQLRHTSDLSKGVGIIDIGSNSVRLVVYADRGRTLQPIFNEKVLCGLGRSVASTGELDGEAVDRALTALARFRGLTSALGISDLQAVATAAVREASNGDYFIERAEHLCGGPISILSGHDEARFAAEGVIAGFPDADGVVGDLGGGSLELVDVANGRYGEGITLPVGPLRLIDMSGNNIARAREIVAEAFAQADWTTGRPCENFYAVGGNWRNLAKLHMYAEEYPLRVLQAYTVRKREAIDVSRLIAGQSPKSLERIPDVSRKRLDTLPFAALVMEKVLEVTGAARLVISAYGVREGLLYARLADQDRRADPLLAWATGVGERLGRFAEHGEELVRFTAPLFQSGQLMAADAGERRLHHAACHLSDMAWRIHPDYRSQHVLTEILRAPVAGIDHPGRVYLAIAVANRYRKGTNGDHDGALSLLDEDRARRAEALGLALRLGHIISAGAPRLVTGFRLQPEADKLTLIVPSARKDLLGESVAKRLNNLARALGTEPDIRISDA
ncbi:exopolyphosphatase [Pyruvatibacter mobilis]|uniref:Ppx/GppA phosphatase family protein n=1 Tax=Pyruvatibacter mobilis TaxID=1712261 RepID=UPI003C7A5F23